MVASARGASDRYEILLKLASGGMGSVYVARMRGALGFRQLVAIKKPHPHLLVDAKARRAVVEEAKLTSSIRHVNVVTMRDVDHHDGEVALVMDYVEGGSVIDLLRDASGMPVAIAVRIALDACAGLHAAHEATDEAGNRLSIIHRDVSPHNIMVGTDGVSRVTDFGIAKSLGGSGEGTDTTGSGGVKGKLAYMAPEYLQGSRADRRVDVFAMGAVLWEAIEGKRLFRAGNDLETLVRLLKDPMPPAPHAGPAVNAVLQRALARAPEDRYQTADEMAEDLDRAAKADGQVATHREVGVFVKERVGAALDKRMTDLREAHRRRQQTTGSMSAIEVAEPPVAAVTPGSALATEVPKGGATGVPSGLSRTSLTMDMGAAKGDFAATDSGVSIDEGKATASTSSVPTGVADVTVALARPRTVSYKPLLVGALLAAVLGSVAAVVAARLTASPPASGLATSGTERAQGGRTGAAVVSPPLSAPDMATPIVPTVGTLIPSAVPSQSTRPSPLMSAPPKKPDLHPPAPTSTRKNPYETPAPR